MSNTKMLEVGDTIAVINGSGALVRTMKVASVTKTQAKTESGQRFHRNCSKWNDDYHAEPIPKDTWSTTNYVLATSENVCKALDIRKGIERRRFVLEYNLRRLTPDQFERVYNLLQSFEPEKTLQP